MRHYFLLGIVLLANGCAPMGSAAGDSRPLPGIHGTAIPENELAVYEAKAINGDPDAALQLVSHHTFAQYDRSKAIYWAQIAAENGSIPGQYNLGFLLRDDPDPRNRARARYWLRRAAAAGDPLAGKLLEGLEQEQ